MDSVRKVNKEGCKDLETIRKELDLPVTRFCELIGLTRKSYYNAKNGTDTRLSLDQWRRLMEYWLRSGKSVEQLIGCSWQDSQNTSDHHHLEKVAV
jgi:hypothetical protein